MRAPYHVHMNFVADHRYVITFTQGRYCGQLFPRPDFAGRVLRATAAAPCFPVLTAPLPARPYCPPSHALFSASARKQRYAGCLRWLYKRHRKPGYGPPRRRRARTRGGSARDHINDRRPIHHGFGINLTVKALPEPVRHGGQKFVIFPATVAKHPVVYSLVQRIGNAGAVAKSISEMVKGSRSAAPKRSAT